MLIFLPSTEDEAAFIQRCLFAMGYKWGGKDGTQNVHDLSSCVETGMVLGGVTPDYSGKLYTSPLAEDYKQGLLCTPEQLDKNYVAAPSPSFLEKFNALAEQVQAIHDEVMPKNLDKGFFIKKDPKP